MRIGLCMSVLNGGGGNDTVFNSLRRYLEDNGHYVTIFTKDDNENILPRFGIFRQLQTIYSESMNKMDLLIFLTGIPPRNIKIPISYYHQQMPAIINANSVPPKYKKGLWRLYYGIFQSVAGFRSAYLDDKNIKHFAISAYLQKRLKSEMNIDSTVLYPAVDVPKFISQNKKEKAVITICRISPEKNLLLNIIILNGLHYKIIGSTNPYTHGYAWDLQKQLDYNHILLVNIPRSDTLKILSDYKVYFSSSEETLGMSVLESIKAGCIPIVANNTGNKETVPFNELRFNTVEQAKLLTDKALNNEFDYMLPELIIHINKFTENNYQQLIGVNKIEQVI